MMFVQHRVNDIARLAHLPSDVGAEVDLRSDRFVRNRLFLQHDAWPGGANQPILGDEFEGFLDHWQQHPGRGPLILNTKEDGLEDHCLSTLARRRIEHFLFLDTSLPTLFRLAKRGLGAHLALRLSAVEPASSLVPWLAMKPGQRPKYLWVDCFSHTPLPIDTLSPLARDFVPILVSPDLQGDQTLATLPTFLPLAALCQVVCTKDVDAWRSSLAASNSAAKQVMAL